MDANVSTKTMPVQNLLRYISFKSQCTFWFLVFRRYKAEQTSNLHLLGQEGISFLVKLKAH